MLSSFLSGEFFTFHSADAACDYRAVRSSNGKILAPESTSSQKRNRQLRLTAKRAFSVDLCFAIELGDQIFADKLFSRVIAGYCGPRVNQGSTNCSAAFDVERRQSEDFENPQTPLRHRVSVESLLPSNCTNRQVSLAREMPKREGLERRGCPDSHAREK